MITKTQKVINLYNEGKLNKALAIVQTFRNLPNGYSKIFKIGHTCINNPEVYKHTHDSNWIWASTEEAYYTLDLWVLGQKNL